MLSRLKLINPSKHKEHKAQSLNSDDRGRFHNFELWDFDPEG